MEGGICLRCGAPYEAEATVCYSCGAPIGETRSNTQPVPVMRRIKPDDSSADVTRPAGQVAVSSSPMTPVAPAPPSRPIPLTTRKRKRPLWPVLLLACALVLGAFGGAAYVLRLVTASPNVSQQTVYNDPAHRFSFRRPTLWQVSTTSTGALLTDGSGNNTVVVTVRTAGGEDTAASAADVIAMPLNLTAGPAQDIAGATWEQRSGQETGTDGAVRQYLVLATVHSGKIYTIECTSPVASFSGMNALAYQPLLSSFTFGAA